MSGRQLSEDVISLIHHVHLNEAGWWKKAVGQIVRAVFWTQSEPLSVSEVAKKYHQLVGIFLPELELRKHIDALMVQNVLAEGADGIYLQIHSRKEMDVSHAEACREQEECRAAFIRICDEKCSGLNSMEVWSAFSKALAHAVKTAGANLFHLLAGDRLLREVDWPALLLNKFDPSYREDLRVLLAEFLGEDNSACRNVILRHLSAHFFAEAAQLRPETINAVEQGRRRRQVKIVLDTNFIFSILELHDNPGDDSALSLLNLAESAGSHIDIRFYALPGTLDEAQRTLISQQHLVERIRAQPNVARAALGSALPSIARKYFATAARVGGLSSSAYFDPFISDLRTILRGKNIHILDPQSMINMRQDVVDDTLAEQARENSEVPESRRKGYEKILHDVVLWHAVNDRRNGSAADPFDVEYWGVTVDWSLIGFDRRKRGAGVNRLPVLLHPSSLLQLMQFWVPRTQSLEEGLVDSLRLPLLFQSFDPVDERATIRVLEVISRFENVEDIPESTLRLVLANQALRARLKDVTASNDEIFELVREELIAEHKETVERLGEARSQLGVTQGALERQGGELLAMQERLHETQQLQVDAEGAAAVARAEIKVRQDEVAAGKIREGSLEGAVRSQERLLFLVLFLVVPVILGVTVSVTGSVLLLDEKFGHLTRVFFCVAGFLVPSALAFCIAPWYIKGRKNLSDWAISRCVAWVGKKFVLLPIGLAIAGIFQGAVWDSVKNAIKSHGDDSSIPKQEAPVDPNTISPGSAGKNLGSGKQERGRGN